MRLSPLVAASLILLSGCAEPGRDDDPSGSTPAAPLFHATACEEATAVIRLPIEAWEGTQPPGFVLVTDSTGRFVDFFLATTHCEAVSPGDGPLDETWGYIPVIAPAEFAAADESHLLAVGGVVATASLADGYVALGLDRAWLSGNSSLTYAPSALGEEVVASASGASDRFRTTARVEEGTPRAGDVRHTVWFTADQKVVGAAARNLKTEVVAESPLSSTEYQGPLGNAPPLMTGRLTLSRASELTIALRPLQNATHP